jgi:hypothetical protein
MSNYKRLMKDLPFLSAGSVVNNFNSSYSVNGGRMYYGGSSSGSDKGNQSFTEPEMDIIALCWDNIEWFEDADLKHITIIPTKTSITLKFKPIDEEDAHSLAMGIQHILPLLSGEHDSGNHTWNKFTDITTEFSNN